MKLLQEIDAYLRAKGDACARSPPRSARTWQIVEILRADGHLVKDIRPLVQRQHLRRRRRRRPAGDRLLRRRRPARASASSSPTDALASTCADEALRQALVNLDAVPAPAGTFDIVLGAGWPGVMLHEAVGHGLEGDFNRKKTSAFAGLMGQQVAAKGVTVVDDGTIAERRGSLTIDDEGTPTDYNVLIEDGKLVGYMQDRQNARLMGMAADRQRPPPVLRPRADAAHDQHR